MITLRRAGDRHHELRGRREVWHTFRAGAPKQSFGGGFGALEMLDEHRLPPGTSILTHSPHGAEVLTYVHEGALACEDSTGHSGVLQVGEFQRMTVGIRGRQRKSNAARSDWAHVFQIWLRRSDSGLEQRYEQRLFTAAERRGGLCLVASPDSRRGSLRTESTLVYSAVLAPGQHVVHDLTSQRSAWLHVVHGEVTLGDAVLTSGDGAGLTRERSVSVTANESSEILLCDLAELRPLRFSSLPPGGGGARHAMGP